MSRNVTQKWKDKGILNNYQSKFVSLFRDLKENKYKARKKKKRKTNQRMMAHSQVKEVLLINQEAVMSFNHHHHLIMSVNDVMEAALAIVRMRVRDKLTPCCPHVLHVH